MIMKQINHIFRGEETVLYLGLALDLWRLMRIRR
jgi:hypothetical protein